MRSYLVLVCSKDRVFPQRYTCKRKDVRWDRDGEIRRIPSHVLADCYQHWLQVETRYWQPPMILWDQCEPLPEQRLPVTLNPRPRSS